METKTEPVWVIERKSRSRLQEPVFGHQIMLWLFGQKNLAQSSWFSKFIATQPLISKFIGWLAKTSISRHLIEGFIQKHRVQRELFEEPLGGWASFEDFFSRRIKVGTRHIASDPSTAVMPADGRYRFFEKLDGQSRLKIKERIWSLKELAGARAERYQGSIACLVRLCPSDYHRFHSPISGHVTTISEMPGPLYSVHPWSLAQDFGRIITNHRVAIEIMHPHFGACLMTFIGATCIGSIEIGIKQGQFIQQGQEIGAFHFGGSAIMVLFEGKRWEFCADLHAAFNEYEGRYEVVGAMGEPLASFT